MVLETPTHKLHEIIPMTQTQYMNVPQLMKMSFKIHPEFTLDFYNCEMNFNSTDIKEKNPMKITKIN